MLEINFFNDSSSFISCNFARLYAVTEVQKASMALIITYCVSLVFVLFVGCPMYLAIVHYEHFGGDSQKRSLANMIFTNICIFVILDMMTLYFGIGLRIIVGPMYHWLSNLLVGTNILFSSTITLTLLFSIVLKNSQLLKPSLATSFNDNVLYIVVSFGTLSISAFPAHGASESMMKTNSPWFISIMVTCLVYCCSKFKPTSKRYKGTNKKQTTI